MRRQQVGRIVARVVECLDPGLERLALLVFGHKRQPAPDAKKVSTPERGRETTFSLTYFAPYSTSRPSRGLTARGCRLGGLVKAQMRSSEKRPNIVSVLTGNPGYGELGSVPAQGHE